VDAAVTLAPVRRSTDNRLADSINNLQVNKYLN